MRRPSSKPSTGWPPTRWVGESGVTQVGVRGFERAELAHERVELGVGDLRRVALVVQRFVVANLIAERGDAVGGGHAKARGRSG